MKVAVLLSGHTRNFEETFPSFKQYIVDPLQPDIFIAGHPNKFGFDDNLAKLHQLYQPKQLLFKEYAPSYNTEWHGLKPPHESVNIEAVFSQYKNLLSASQLMSTFAYCNNIKYDLVIRARFDYFWTRSFSESELQAAKSDRTVLNPSCWDYAVFAPYAKCDVVAIGNMQTMVRYCLLWECLLDYYQQKVPLHPETMLGYHLWQSNIKRIDIDKPVSWENSYGNNKHRREWD